jgi:hypothetical protein
MEAELKIKKSVAEWICCEYGLTNRVTICIRVENGDTPHDAKVTGLRGNGETTYIKMPILQSLFHALLPFLQEVRVAQERTKLPDKNQAG